MASHELLPGEQRAITVDRQRWVDYLPGDCWPSSFAEMGQVTRGDVFKVADQWCAGDVSSRVFTAAVLAWGYGTTGYGRWRTGRTLAADPDGTRLESKLEPLRAEKISGEALQSVYSAFLAKPRLPWLGPAFFTKLIYFAGYRRGVGGIQPLILDRVVAGRIPADAGVRPRAWLWSCAEWTGYLKWAANQTTGEPDEVEMALFAGRPLP